MTDTEAIDIINQCVNNVQVTVKDAKLIIEAWEQLKTKLNGRHGNRPDHGKS